MTDENNMLEEAKENSDLKSEQENEKTEHNESKDLENEKVEDGKASFDNFENMYVRLSADFQNFKKRSEKEKTDIYKSANSKLITELLPLIDDFDRALEHLEESEKETFANGIKLIIKRFAEILFKEGLEYIETKDAIFDPNLHHAVMLESVEGEESGKILQELQKGYKVNGKVIRPSMVKVAE